MAHVDYFTDPFHTYKSFLQKKGSDFQRMRKAIINGDFTCPNVDGTKGVGGCIFCNNAAFSPAHHKSAVPIKEQVEHNIEFLKRRYGAKTFIAFFQANSNTYGDIKRLEELYKTVLEYPQMVGLSVSTRPDCVSNEIIDLLDDLGNKKWVTLEIGVQTSFDNSLKLVNRCHTFYDTQDTLNRCQNKHFDLCLHFILGLPSETRENWLETAKKMSAWQYQMIKITQLYVVKNTKLAKDFKEGLYIPLSLSEYVSGVVDFLERVPYEVGVQRFQGSAPKYLYLSPIWALDIETVKEAIIDEFHKRQTYQGIFSTQLVDSPINPQIIAPTP